MKKKNWLLALLIALTIFITACTNPASTDPITSLEGVWIVTSYIFPEGTETFPVDFCADDGSVTDNNGNGLMELDMDGDDVSDEEIYEEFIKITETSLNFYGKDTLTNINDNTDIIDFYYSSSGIEKIQSNTDTVIITDKTTYNITLSGNTATLTYIDPENSGPDDPYEVQ